MITYRLPHRSQILRWNTQSLPTSTSFTKISFGLLTNTDHLPTKNRSHGYVVNPWVITFGHGISAHNASNM
jgi:hypothetical protein